MARSIFKCWYSIRLRNRGLSLYYRDAKMTDQSDGASRSVKFRKLPVEVEAMQFKGVHISLLDYCSEFDEWITAHQSDRKCRYIGNNKLQIHITEGVMTASLNDWVICGVMGELYPCKPDIFELTYEAVK